MATWILAHLDARDRALFERFVIGPTSRRAIQLGWRTVTHVGGFWCSVLAAGLPWFASGELHEASGAAMTALALSHLVVQILKRSCGRVRPSLACGRIPLITVPDQFSFPSGHACASMAVALVYALAFPALVIPLIAIAAVVGFSRVCLGVHYPGDVLIGQLIAAATTIVLWAL